MSTQVLFFDVFFEKDPHLNADEFAGVMKFVKHILMNHEIFFYVLS